MNGDSSNRTSNDRSPTVTEDGAIVRTAADVLSSPSRQKAAATVAASNPVLAKWGKHRLACPPQCIECEMRAEIERLARELNDAQGNLRVAWGQRDDQERTWIKTRDERDRLRAALEELRDETEAVMHGEHGADWADHFTPLFNLIQRAKALSGEPGSAHETKPEPDVGVLNRQLCEAEGHVFSRFAMHHCLRCEAAVTPGGYLAYTSSKKASSEPSSGSGCPACGVMYVSGARHFSGCPLHPGESVQNGSERQEAER